MLEEVVLRSFVRAIGLSKVLILRIIDLVPSRAMTGANGPSPFFSPQRPPAASAGNAFY